MALVLIITTAFQIYRPKAEQVFDPGLLKEKAPVPVWVFFTDKGFVDSRSLGMALNLGKARDFDHLATAQQYIDQVSVHGGRLRHRSKWLNGASFWIRPDLIPRLAELPFVHKILKVKQPVVREPYHPYGPEEEPDSAYYGYTYLQNAMFNIPEVHALGVYGSGVRIGMLDTGFKRKHAALNHIKVADEYDFLSGDYLYRYVVGSGYEQLNIPPQGLVSGLTGIVKGDTTELFFVADTTYFSLPVREVLEIYAPDGSNWYPPEDISEGHSYNWWTGDPAVAGNETINVVWSLDRGSYYLYHRRKANGNWSSKITVTMNSRSLRNPTLDINQDTLFLCYVQGDSTLILKRGFGLSWPAGSTQVYTGGHKIYKPDIVSVGDTFIIAAHTKFPDAILISRSTDRGQSFSTAQIATGYDPVIKQYGDSLYLLFKETDAAQLITVALSRSGNMGISWTTPETIDSSFSFGGSDLRVAQNQIDVVYESYGRIYHARSPEFSTTLIDSNMVYYPCFVGSDIYYFRRGDDDTGYDPLTDRQDQPDHGTRMLGLIGGLVNGSYVGVAYGAEFLIAKTERTGFRSSSFYEFPVEEDTWIEGLEWLEANGAQVITSSLGYIDWYDYEDLDGKTAPISIVARKAAENGLVIVSAIGNRNDTTPPLPPYLTAPGDAEGIVTVGGVQPDSSYAPIGGFGPTVDGRTKPELVALAKSWLEEQKGVIVVNPDSTAEYLFSGGTSTATALVAGICALVLEGHPQWAADSLKMALFETASRANNPNDTIGYGLPNAYAALFYTTPDIDTLTETKFLPPFPNPFIPQQHQYQYFPFFVALNRISPTLSIYTLDGRLVYRQEREQLLSPGKYDQKNQDHPSAAFCWEGNDDQGRELPSGIYIAVIHDGFGADRCKFAIIR